MSDLESQLKELMSCKICFEERDNQKQLPCQHTICLDCLNKLKVNDSKYKCPMCNKEMMVPNNGFEELPDSLITKQLSMLIHMREWEKGASSGDDSPRPAATAVVEESEASRKLRVGLQKAKSALGSAEEKMETYTKKQTELRENEEKIVAKINKLVEERITELRERAATKITAIKEVSDAKNETLNNKMTCLQQAMDNATQITNKLKTKMEELKADQTQTDINSELHQGQESVDQLNNILLTPDPAGGVLKEGDSVRLQMIEELVEQKFLDRDTTHASVGFIHEVNDEGRCAIIFPGHSAWVGNTKTLERSPIKHDLPMIGDRVRIRKSVEKPFFDWGNVKPESIGTLTELQNRGPKVGREVEVDFPENHSWKGVYDELEKLPPEPLKVGEEVWIKVEVTEPSRGWAGVTPLSVGRLLSVCDKDVKVNFPECEVWNGLLSEIERTRPISVGDKVRVMKSVETPITGWAGVDHDDEGIVKKIHNSSEHGSVAHIDFPNRLGLWKCVLSELELVSRSGSRAKNKGIQLDLHRMAAAAAAAQMSTMETLQQANQCATQ